MKSTIRKSTYKAIYRLLDRVFPLSMDCGELCGAACCSCGDGRALDGEEEDFELGIYLYPGEEKLFTRREKWLRWSVEEASDYEFPDSWRGKIYFINCTCAPHCPRQMRPLQCRFFPLTPHLTGDGRLNLILSPLELPYECPLIRDRLRLTPAFIRATYTVWTHLIRDPLIFDLVEFDSAQREEMGKELVFVPVPRRVDGRLDGRVCLKGT